MRDDDPAQLSFGGEVSERPGERGGVVHPLARELAVETRTASADREAPPQMREEPRRVAPGEARPSPPRRARSDCAAAGLRLRLERSSCLGGRGRREAAGRPRRTRGCWRALGSSRVPMAPTARRHRASTPSSGDNTLRIGSRRRRRAPTTSAGIPTWCPRVGETSDRRSVSSTAGPRAGEVFDGTWTGLAP